MHQPHFYFDFISPFAYLAWTRLPAIESECQVHIEPADEPVGDVSRDDDADEGHHAQANEPADATAQFSDVAQCSHGRRPLIGQVPTIRLNYAPRTKRGQAAVGSCAGSPSGSSEGASLCSSPDAVAVASRPVCRV